MGLYLILNLGNVKNPKCSSLASLCLRYSRKIWTGKSDWLLFPSTRMKTIGGSFKRQKPTIVLNSIQAPLLGKKCRKVTLSFCGGSGGKVFFLPSYHESSCYMVPPLTSMYHLHFPIVPPCPLMISSLLVYEQEVLRYWTTFPPYTPFPQEESDTKGMAKHVKH